MLGRRVEEVEVGGWVGGWVGGAYLNGIGKEAKAKGVSAAFRQPLREVFLLGFFCSFYLLLVWVGGWVGG